MQRIDCGNFSYLGEVEEFNSGLPKDCIFNKVKTGCGGTTIALTDSSPTIICVPLTELIDNKINQSNKDKHSYPYEILGIYAGFKPSDVTSYLKRAVVPKIMVTYDSLMKLSSCLNPKDFNLLIDEYHCLLTAYDYRSTACDTVLNNFKKFKSYTFMSATPIPEDFVFNQLKGIEMVEASWTNLRLPKIIGVMAEKSLTATLINNVNKFLKNEIEGNAYIFINSLDTIDKVIKECDLKESNTRVIYSRHSERVLRNGIKRSKSSDIPKRINFLTSSAFEGCDIYDPEGRTIIVTDGAKTHTLLDIEMQIVQIIGRIRNTKYTNEIYHIFSKRYNTEELSYQEYKTNLDIKMDKARSKMFFYTDQRQALFIKAIFINTIKHNHTNYDELDFISIDNETNEPYLDSNQYNTALFKYKLYNETYSDLLSFKKEYTTYRDIELLTIKDSSEFLILPEFEGKNILDLTIRFKQERDGGKINIITLQQFLAAAEKFPFYKEAVLTLGFEPIIELAGNHQKIKSELKTRSRQKLIQDKHQEIIKELIVSLDFSPNKFVSSYIIKKSIKEAYKELGIPNNGVVSNEITKFFNTLSGTDSVVKIQNKTVRGCILIEPNREEVCN
jgi:hypothetical protein